MYTVSFAVLLAVAVTFVAVVAVAALPDVFWFPVAFTPGKLIAAVPSNTALTITMDSGYTNTDTTGYQIDKYDPKTLYIIAT